MPGRPGQGAAWRCPPWTPGGGLRVMDSGWWTPGSGLVGAEPHITGVMTLPFLKMHGLGNDFVVIDARNRPLALSEDQVRAIADRRTGVGCDQFIVIEPAADPGADAFMRIRNPDGSEAGACGNATRC